MSMTNSLPRSVSSSSLPYKTSERPERSGKATTRQPPPAVKHRAMPPSLHPPHPQSHTKLKRRHYPAVMAKKGLAAILYKLRDVHHRSSPPSPPSPSTPSAHYSQRCYPPPPSAWPWPSCRHPRTSSFRGRPSLDENAAAAVFRTANTVFDTSSEHFFARRRSSSMDAAPPPGVAAEEEQQAGDEEDKETAVVVRGVRSERLFFEPAGAVFLPKQVAHCACLPLSEGMKAPVESAPSQERFQQLMPPPERGDNEATVEASVEKDDESSAASAAPSSDKEDEERAAAAVTGGSAVVVTVESKDPYGDFRTSMAEMVAAHGLRDWDALEELLAWYLKLNAKGVHAAIVGAFIDLLVSMQQASSWPPASQQASSPPPTSPSPSSSCITFEEYSSTATAFEDEEKS